MFNSAKSDSSVECMIAIFMMLQNFALFAHVFCVRLDRLMNLVSL